MRPPETETYMARAGKAVGALPVGSIVIIPPLSHITYLGKTVSNFDPYEQAFKVVEEYGLVPLNDSHSTPDSGSETEVFESEGFETEVFESEDECIPSTDATEPYASDVEPMGETAQQE